MKFYFPVLLFMMSVSLTAQNHVNTKRGFAAEGYDVVAYFSNEALKGDKDIVATHEGVDYAFSSEENRKQFNLNPDQYVPAYGGYCAYAIGAKADKVGINPKTFQIVDRKLYLFYNSWGVNTLDKWNEEGGAMLKAKADQNWQTIIQQN